MLVSKAMSTSLTVPKSRGIGNSQILPYDTIPSRYWTGVREMAEQVAIRLRRKKDLGLHSASYSKIEGFRPFCQQRLSHPIPQGLSDTVLQLFRSKYEGGAIRQVVFLWNLSRSQLFSLFDDPVALEKEEASAAIMHSGPIWPHLFERLLITRKLAIAVNYCWTFRRRLRWINMIDRSYLPYQSAREFQDRGMAEWSWLLFIENTAALHTKEIDRSQLGSSLLNRSAPGAGLPTTNDDLGHDYRGINLQPTQEFIHTLYTSNFFSKWWPLCKSPRRLYHFIESETAYETYSD